MSIKRFSLEEFTDLESPGLFYTHTEKKKKTQTPSPLKEKRKKKKVLLLSVGEVEHVSKFAGCSLLELSHHSL